MNTNSFKEILEYPLFSIHHYTLYVYELLGLVTILGVAFLIDKIAKKLLYKSTRIDKGSQYAFYQIIHYIVIIITFALCMRMMGINISPLLVGSGAILVGIGLGLQNLFLDFISGVIILMERSIRVGDILDMDGVMGKVIQINMRTSKLLTTDNRVMIFPNSYLTKDKLINYSSYGEFNSFTIDVGVDYDTDIELVQKLLLDAARENPFISKTPEPFCRLVDFGDSSLNLRLHFFSENPFIIAKIKSDVRLVILEKFRVNNINIPYPIRTIKN